MTITINVEYNIGDVVYLVTDEDNRVRIVADYSYNHGHTMYLLRHIDEESWHYGFELSTIKTF